MDSLMSEVDLLLTKIRSLPENERKLAISKIHDQLSFQNVKTPEDDQNKVSQLSLSPVTDQEGLQKREDIAIPSSSFITDAVFEQTDKGENDHQDSDIEVLVGLEDAVSNVIEHPDSIDAVLSIKVPALQCDICGVCLKNKASLRGHLKIHCQKEQSFECKVCHNTFRKLSNLRVHQKRHENQRDFPCSKCDYKSITKIDLDRHFSSAHSKTHDNICEYCGRTFSAKRLLNSHIKTVHTINEPAFNCAHCRYVAKLKSNLRVHIQLKHLGDYYTHVCPVCGAKVTLKSAYLEHLRAHTGDRPFQCDLCTSSFACRGRLNAHKRTIHNPRQFDCKLCSKKFPTKHSLERHTNSHLNTKPNACPFCQFACNMLGNLTKHIRNRHNMPDFSMRDFKKQKNVVIGQEKKTWTEKGVKELDHYLLNLSQKLGREVTVQELKSQEQDKRKHMTAVVEKAKLDRINKINTKEHSYFQKPAPPSVTSLPHVLPNIYTEAIAAANLDFSSATMADLPNLLTDSSEGFCVDTSSLILPSDISELRDSLLPNFTDMLSLGLENYSLPVMDAPNCFVQLPTGEKVQLNLQDQQLGGVELPVLGQSDGLMQNEFLSATNTYMIVLAERTCEVMPLDESQLHH